MRMRGFPVSASGFSRTFWHAFHSGFRRPAGSLSRAQGLRRSWGRLSSVVCRPVRPWLFDWPWLRPEAAQETPTEYLRQQIYVDSLVDHVLGTPGLSDADKRASWARTQPSLLRVPA